MSRDIVASLVKLRYPDSQHLVGLHHDFCPDFQTQEQQRSTEQRQISLKTTPAADRGR